MKFTALGFEPEILEAIESMGFDETTPIQEKAIPEILKGRDLIACAQTGTGKTAAFLLPVLNRIVKDGLTNTTALIVVPTRELALQIDQQVQGLGYFANVDSISLYGGGQAGDFVKQKRSMKGGVNIIIATPGKLISHLIPGNLNTKSIKYLILDEADRMLDMGFYDDIVRIISYMPKERQNLFFSATMPPKIRQLGRSVLKNPLEVSIAIAKPSAGIVQQCYLVYDGQKTSLLKGIIEAKPEYKSILIFSSTKKKVSEIIRSLKTDADTIEGISSDFEQKEREDALLRFAAKKTRILVATDVISRGIDIKDINLVINYDVPSHAEDYVHRIGRTARADTTGVAITLVNERDMPNFQDIEKLIEREVPKVNLPKELGEGPVWKAPKTKKNFKKKWKKRPPKKHNR